MKCNKCHNLLKKYSAFLHHPFRLNWFNNWNKSIEKGSEKKRKKKLRGRLLKNDIAISKGKNKEGNSDKKKKKKNISENFIS